LKTSIRIFPAFAKDGAESRIAFLPATAIAIALLTNAGNNFVGVDYN
jgi:hypothetical protein